MKIALTEIRGLDRRVRNQMDPKKLEELSDSIKELGVLQPVKVRKNGHGYTLVFGHRRVQAAKSAGLKEIEAIIEDVPDDKLLTQALAENVIREDMAAIDIAKALALILKETGCTQDALATKLGWVQSNVSNYLAMLEPDLGLTTSGKYQHADIGQGEVMAAKAGTDGDLKLAGKVLRKAADDNLTRPQIRQVAEVVKRASDFGGEKAVKRVLAQPVAQILAAAPTLPTRKPKPVVREVKGRVLFQWIKDPRAILAEEGLKAVSALVSAIVRGPDDKAGGKIVLKSLRKLTANVLAQIDSALGRM